MTTNSGLADGQVRQLRDRGYLLVPDLIDEATIEAVRSELHEIVDDVARRLHAEGKLPEAYSDAGFDRQLAKIAQHDLDAAREVIALIKGGQGAGELVGPATYDLLTHPRLLDAVESIVGPEIIGSSVYRLRPKAPGLQSGAVPWHQDSGYLLSHCDDQLIVTCWIPLIDATLENGCLHVIPDAHKGGILRHHTGGPSGFLVVLDDDLPEDLEPIAIPVPKGGVLFLTNLTPHASYLNNSDHMRWSLDLRYQSPDVPHNIDKHPSDIDPDGPEIEIACYPPEADFILRSPSHPEREVRSWKKLKKIRDEYFARRSELRVHMRRWSAAKET